MTTNEIISLIEASVKYGVKRLEVGSFKVEFSDGMAPILQPVASFMPHVELSNEDLLFHSSEGAAKVA